MNLQLPLTFLSIIVLCACGISSKNNFTSNNTEYAFITEIQQNGDSTYLVVDYVQYLTGDSAIAAAIQEGNADTVEIDGKISIGVPNDYYILNSSPKLRKFAVDKKCEFDFLLELDRVNIEKIDNSLHSLKKIYKDAPFILTINRNKTVVRLEEVFLP